MLARIYRWWLNGYPSEILEEMLKSAKEGSLKERLIKEILESISDTQNFGERLDPLVRNSVSNENLMLEEKNEALEPRVKSLETPFQTLNRPSREDLEALKKALGLEKGSLQYKRKGDAVYHVTYDRGSKRHKWKRLGSWKELKAVYLEGVNS